MMNNSKTSVSKIKIPECSHCKGQKIENKDFVTLNIEAKYVSDCGQVPP